jgi:hypothetical protein
VEPEAPPDTSSAWGFRAFEGSVGLPLVGTPQPGDQRRPYWIRTQHQNEKRPKHSAIRVRPLFVIPRTALQRLSLLHSQSPVMDMTETNPHQRLYQRTQSDTADAVIHIFLFWNTAMPESTTQAPRPT